MAHQKLKNDPKYPKTQPNSDILLFQLCQLLMHRDFLSSRRDNFRRPSVTVPDLQSLFLPFFIQIGLRHLLTNLSFFHTKDIRSSLSHLQ